MMKIITAFCSMLILISTITAQTTYPDRIRNIKLDNLAKSRIAFVRDSLRNEKHSKWIMSESAHKHTKSEKNRRVINAIPSAERSALIALYNSTNGDGWTDNSGWKNPPLDADGFALPGTENTWNGISVNADHVEDIVLTSNNLTGTIPTELGNLPNLVTLYLSENNLTGSIPVEIGGLANLEELVLNTNQLSGPIPTGIADPGDLPALWGMDLGNNNFNGNIPSQLGNLGALEFLYLDQNELSGSVPAELGNLSNLVELDLYSNDLDGTIIPGFADPGDLPNLEYLDLGSNYLTGSIPGELGNLSALEELYLDENNLTGGIPAQLGNLANLIYIDLSYNQLDGSIEAGFADFGDLPNLEYLILEYNDLTGTIPAGIGNLSSLRYFVADNNKLNGSIPPGIGNLGNLLLLYLYENQLSGSIPPELGDLNSLFELDLWNNQLSGTIPSGMFDLGELPNLVYLDLSTNQLTGAIPSSISSLPNLELFAAVENQLNTIPQELGELNSLIELYLFDNQFTSIPAGMLGVGDFPNLEVLDLCLNELNGSIPIGFENLASLEELYISGNKYSGDIPPELMNIANLDDGCLDIRWNALHTGNTVLKTFLNVKQDGGDWENTQTIAPQNFISYRNWNVTYLSWTPILYTGNTGVYDIYFSTTQGGPYTYYGSTNDKTTSSFSLVNMAKNSAYYFIVQTKTNPHADNNNTVVSENSVEIFVDNINTSSYPEIIVNTGADVIEGGTILITNNMLSCRDLFGSDLSVRYYVKQLPAHGSIVIVREPNLQKGVDEVSDVTAFTQNDINLNRVYYQQNGDDTISDSFKFTLMDGDGEESPEYNFNITIIPVNDPPLFTDLPEQITFICGEYFTFDIYDCISDAETPDAELHYEFTPSDNSLFTSFNAETGELSLTAAEGFSGNVDLLVRVEDPEGASAEETINVTVEPAVTSFDDLPGIPDEYQLMQNYPNPFNPTTTIRYGLPEASNVKLVVYNVLGQQVAVLVNQQQDAGYYNVTFNGSRLNSGIYIFKIQSRSYTEVRKMILMK